MITDRNRIPLSEFQQGTGWELKPQGACRGDICIPVPPSALSGREVEVSAMAAALNMPLVHDDSRGLTAVGPAVVAGRQLETAEAPDLVLPDLEGRAFVLSSLRGQKVLLIAWAPY